VVAKIANNYLWPHFRPNFSSVLACKISMQHGRDVLLVPNDRCQ
jgi:hypothetical protein